MKKKHKKQLMKFLISLILMLVITTVGYLKNTLEDEHMLTKTVRKAGAVV